MNGRQIRAARIAAGITQQDLADRCGVTQPAVAQWERGRTEPGPGPAAILTALFAGTAPTTPAGFVVAAQALADDLRAAHARLGQLEDLAEAHGFDVDHLADAYQLAG